MQNKDQTPDYGLFIKWFTSNGGLLKDIQFPTKFPPTNYIGVSAAVDIKPNVVFMAVPYRMTIGVSLVRESQLAPILKQYEIFSDLEDDQADFNILTLFLIYEKMKGAESFYYPYMQTITNTETMVDWTNQQIRKMADPLVDVEYVQQMREGFGPIYTIFTHIAKKYPALFPEELTYKLFYECYSTVMTRCFGWSMPETMLVPFADFLNHSTYGVNHYMLSKYYQETPHAYYIKKRTELDLTLLGINNTSQLPKTYQPNTREDFVHRHRQILDKKNIDYDHQIRMTPQLTNKALKAIQQQLLAVTPNIPLLLSSDSEDNDTESSSDSSDQNQVKQSHPLKQIDFRKILKSVRVSSEDAFEDPKPWVNREFDSEVNFEWWKQRRQKNYFIAATSRHTFKGQQIYNSYGSRNNRFLLPWYGFTLEDNKYDSVPFRLWSERVRELIGQSTHTKYITQKDQQKGIRHPKYLKKIPVRELTKEFRLKKSTINLELIVFLRYQLINRSNDYIELLKNGNIKILKPTSLELQQKVLSKYLQILHQLSQKYKIGQERSVSKTGSKDRVYFRDNLLRSNQIIIRTQLQAARLLLTALKSLMNGDQFDQVYKDLLPGQSKQADCQKRKRIAIYLRDISVLSLQRKNN